MARGEPAKRAGFGAGTDAADGTADPTDRRTPMTTFRTDLSLRDRASALGHLLAFMIGIGVLASACDAGDPASPGADIETKTGALPFDLVHGFEILPAGNVFLGVNAYGGAHNGGELKLYEHCPWKNGACTWMYRYGVLLSDDDPAIGISTSDNPVDGERLYQSKHCSESPIPKACKWIYRDGRFISVLNPTLAIYAKNGAKHLNNLVLDSGCVTSSSLNCKWIIQSAVIGTTASFYEDEGEAYMYDAGSAPFNFSPIRLGTECNRMKPTCTWTFRDGMIFSDEIQGLAMNAYGGAATGAQIVLTNQCDVGNPSCRWRLEAGTLYSDTSTLAINPASQRDDATLSLGTNSTNARVQMTVGEAPCGERGLPACGSTCKQGLVLGAGGVCVDLIEKKFRCPPSGSMHAGDVDGSATIGIANDGTWGFWGHAHDRGTFGLNYTLGFTFNNPINGKKRGAVGSGVVHGTLDIGSRDDDFMFSGFSQDLVDNFATLSSGGITCNLHSSVNPWLLGESALVGLGVAVVGAVVVYVQATSTGCTWERTEDGTGIQRRCPL